ncbi:MAG: hypothetical protein LBS75_07655, partial [Synergistaceae bacterium]|nr:hypothetical protein [Synergistaceae bacterium]
VTNAQDGRSYSGLILGAVERGGRHYAAQAIYDGHVILHRIEQDDMPQIAAIVGRKVEIKCADGRIGAIAEEQARYERNRERGR